MKHNGQNIITDKDVTMTGNGFQGEELSGVLSNHQNRIDRLESNVKWIYKNGGVGSGSGGGGGSSTVWRAVVTRGDTGQALTTDSTINLSGVNGEYSLPLRVQIYGGGTNTFRVRCNWVNTTSNGPSPQSWTKNVTSDDSFYCERLMFLQGNGSFSLTILNLDTQEPLVLNVNYIVTSYKFDIYYVFADDKSRFSESNNTIFMSEVKDRGLMVALDYSIAVGLTSGSYSFVDWLGNTIDSSTLSEEYQLRGNYSDKIYLPLVPGGIDSIKNFLSINDNANFVQFSLNLTILLEGHTDVENISTLYLKDNLIPTSMYLKVFTTSGGLYDTSQLIRGTDPETDEPIIVENNYPEDQQFYIGNAVFQVTPYYGAYDVDRSYELSIKLDGEVIDVGISNLRDQQTRPIVVDLNVQNKEYTIEFSIRWGNVSYSRRYYLFVRDSSTSFSWYPEDHSPIRNYSSYYRRNLVDGTLNIQDITPSTKLDQSINSPTKVIRFSSGSPQSLSNYDQFLCVGLQLSSINQEEDPIVSFDCDNKKGTVEIYQNKVRIYQGTGTSNDVEIFFPMINEYDTTNENNYHIISIYRKLDFRENDTYWKNVYIYLDGILEAALSNAISGHGVYKNITLYPGNYCVNLIECSYFQHSDTSTESTWLSDNDILGFSLTYQEQLLHKSIDKNEEELYKEFNRFTVGEDSYVYTDYDTINNIAQKSKVPIMMLSFTDPDGGSQTSPTSNGYNKDNFKAWMETTYNEDSQITPLPVSVGWSEGGSVLSTIKMADGSDASFSVVPQGSSTLGYRCKNWELYAPSAGANSDYKYIYSPNFNSQDTESFLPEESFTLKADVVDSSHTNNNAIANFVNRITTPFSKAKQSGSTYSNYIKNCLTGFPILLFLHTNFKRSPEEQNLSENRYYFLGIYNFNLGRNSYYNLGYKNVSDLEDLGLQSGFHIYRQSNISGGLLSGIGVAEIQGNSNLFDFSQYDESILFKIDSLENDTGYMFGDLVSTDNTTLKGKLVQLLKQTSRAGGYVFNKIGKTFKTEKLSTDKIGYGYDEGYSAEDSEGTPLNQVPNYRYQAKRSYNGAEVVISMQELDDPDVTEQDLTDLILDNDPDRPEDDLTPLLDLRSLNEYYTVCMAFGLVDSVQKNLNIKTWNVKDEKPLWYLAFYDMDTCLGVSNSGSKISFFAFSDYWQSTVSEDNLLGPAKVYRDYSPSDTNTDLESSRYFDIPSTYIFAVSKYTYSIIRNSLKSVDSIEKNPSNLWGLWRYGSTSVYNKQQGCLSSSDYFITNYYADHLKNIPLSAYNYNYIYKYFVKDSSNRKIFSDKNFGKFSGRKLYYTKNWIDGRFHLLDAYFNINGVEEVLHEEGENKYSAPRTLDQYRDRNNSDIYILREIFSNESEGLQYPNLNGEVLVGTRPLSPLIIKTPTSVSRYIFPENGEARRIQFSTSGNQALLFGGSPLWETIDTIDSFINNGSITINSKYFTNIVGTRGVCEHWNLNTPSVKNVSLTGSGYSGELKFASEGTVDEFPNLTSINISGTKISLTVDKVPITTLNASNMQGGNIDIQNVSTLESVSLNNSTLTNLTIPSWKTSNNTITLDTLTCESINIRNTFEGTKLVIKNNSRLTTLEANGFSEISITDCENLSNVSINGIGVLDSPLEKLTITGSADSFKIGEIDNVVDLSKQVNLKSISLQKTSMETVILPPHAIDLPKNAFLDCHKLKYLDSSSDEDNNRSIAYIKGESVFRHCEKFTLKQSNGGWCDIKIDNGITSLATTFSISLNVVGGGSLDLEAAKHFLSVCCDVTNNRVNDVSSLFYNQQNISYNKEKCLEDYGRGVCSLSFSKLPKCNKFSSVFYNTRVFAYNRYMFSGNTSTSSSGITISSMIGSRSTESWHLGNAYATVDFLYEILDKISSFSGPDYNTTYVRFCFVDPSSGNTLENLTLKNIFCNEEGNMAIYPKKLTTISAFHLNTGHILDFTGMFSSEWTAAAQNGITLSDFISRSDHTIVEGSLDNLLKDIPIKSASYVLEAISQTFKVNLRYFLNWDRLDLCTNLFHLSVGTEGGHTNSLGFSKVLTRDDFFYIWKQMLTKLRSSGVSSIFRRANIYNWGNDTRFHIVDETDPDIGSIFPNTYITNIPYLFQDCKVFAESSNIESNPIYLTWDSDFLKYLPNITVAHSSFYGTYWKNTIPFDFFQKRREQIETVYVQDENELGTNTRKLATKYTYTYNNNVTNLRNCFSNIRLENGSPKGFDPDADYNCGKLNQENRTRIVDNDGYTYNTYYLTQLDQSPITLEIPTEESDLENLNGTFSPTIEIQSKLVDNIILGNGNYSEDDKNRLFVSPDALYCCSSNCFVDSVFANTITRDNSWDSNNKDFFVFTGIIPEHFLKNVRNRDISNMFRWLNIIPRKLGETGSNEGGDLEEYYYYVPKNFTDRRDLSNTFNFRLILPKTNQHFYLFLRGSLPTGVTSLDSSLPTTGEGRLLDSSGDFKPYTNKDSVVNYHIMGEPIYDSETEEFIGVRSGIDMSFYRSLKLDNLIYPGLASFLSEEVFIGLTWSKTKYLNNKNNYVIRIGWGAANIKAGGLSYACRLNLPPKNNNFITGSGNNGANNINIDSIPNYNDIDPSTYTSENITFRNS